MVTGYRLDSKQGCVLNKQIAKPSYHFPHSCFFYFLRRRIEKGLGEKESEGCVGGLRGGRHAFKGCDFQTVGSAAAVGFAAH